MVQVSSVETGNRNTGTPLAPTESRAATLASGGVRTPRQMASVFAALIGDALNGRIPHKDGHLACRAGTQTLRAAEFGNNHGHNTIIADAEVAPQPENDPIAEREKELLAELAQIREARKLRN